MKISDLFGFLLALLLVAGLFYSVATFFIAEKVRISDKCGEVDKYIFIFRADLFCD